MKKFLIIILSLFCITSCGKSDGTPEERNDKRISDLTMIESGVKEFYNQKGFYPVFESEVKEAILMVTDKISYEPLGNVNIDGCNFGYEYQVGDIGEMIDGGYKISACLEDNDARAINDGGTEDNKYELGTFENIEFTDKVRINP